MSRTLLPREFSSSTLMDGLLLTKHEPGLDLPHGSADLAQELKELEDWFYVPISIDTVTWDLGLHKTSSGTPAK